MFAFFLTSGSFIVINFLFILFGGILPLFERKYLSVLQRRIGPTFTGFRGRLQFLADAVKVLLKYYTYLKTPNRVLFTLLPALVL